MTLYQQVRTGVRYILIILVPLAEVRTQTPGVAFLFWTISRCCCSRPLRLRPWWWNHLHMANAGNHSGKPHLAQSHQDELVDELEAMFGTNSQST